MEIGEWCGVEFLEEETYEVCRRECGDGECQLAVANRGICPMRSADDFDGIRERMDELRELRIPIPTCPVTKHECVQACVSDDMRAVFCKKAADGGRPA